MAIQLCWLVFFTVLGAVVGSFLNVCIFRLPWQKSIIWPGSRCGHCLQPIRALDNIPILSYLLLRGRCRSCGTRFSARYMLIEALTAALFGLLFWLHWPQLWPQHCRYLHQVVLLSTLIVATFIDLDMQIIPDSVTVSGTVVGLCWAAACPNVLLVPVTAPVPELVGWPPTARLLYGLLLFLMWGLLAVVVWYLWRGGRMGWAEAVLLGGLAALVALHSGSLFWQPPAGWPQWLGKHPHWQGLLSSLIGMAATAGAVWYVRVVGSAALGKEAMGFGDVTLMGLIGSFLGWQAGLLTFFLAPFLGLAVGVAQLIARRGHVLPYGPYLSLAAVVVLIEWQPLWAAFQNRLAVLRLVPAAVAAVFALALLALLLTCLPRARRILQAQPPPGR